MLANEAAGREIRIRRSSEIELSPAAAIEGIARSGQTLGFILRSLVR